MSTKGSRALTARLLSFIPNDWADELPLRHEMRAALDVPMLSIAQRLLALQRQGLIDRRWHESSRWQVRKLEEARDI